MNSRDIGARAQPGIDVHIHTRIHTYTDTNVSRRQSLSIYLSTNLPAATQYETRVTMTFTKGICDCSREK